VSFTASGESASRYAELVKQFDVTISSATRRETGKEKCLRNRVEKRQFLGFGTWIRREAHWFPSKVAENPAFVPKMFASVSRFHKSSLSPPGALAYELNHLRKQVALIASWIAQMPS
jgi:hypothetical protein